MKKPAALLSSGSPVGGVLFIAALPFLASGLRSHPGREREARIQLDHENR